MIVYKIRARNGLFSRGGSYISQNSFNKKGKAWTRKANLSLHLSQLSGDSLHIYNNHGCEIVEYEVLENVIGVTPITQYVTSTRLKSVSTSRSFSYVLFHCDREETSLSSVSCCAK